MSTWASKPRARIAATALALSVVAAAPAGRATDDPPPPLSAVELADMEGGSVVRRELSFERDGADYVGGVAYAIVDASPGEVMETLLDVSAYTRILPLTLDARPVGRRGKDALVAFRQGGRLATASYTAQVRREGADVVRFWLDSKRTHHNITDVYGFFRVAPLPGGRTLLTYAAAVDLGDGLTTMLLGSKVQRYALETPGLVRRYVTERRAERSATPATVTARLAR